MTGQKYLLTNTVGLARKKYIKQVNFKGRITYLLYHMKYEGNCIYFGRNEKGKREVVDEKSIYSNFYYTECNGSTSPQ